MKDMNPRWKDVEDYIKKKDFESAGNCIGVIVLEIVGDENLSQDDVAGLADGIFDECTERKEGVL